MLQICLNTQGTRSTSRSPACPPTLASSTMASHGRILLGLYPWRGSESLVVVLLLLGSLDFNGARLCQLGH